MKSAKDKSMSAINMVKKDLAEFSSVMQEDTIKAASKVKEKLSQENANAATEKVKQGMSSLLGGISKALVVEPDDSYQPAQIVGGEAVVFDRYKARLHALQVDPATYTTEVTGDAYQEWLSGANLDGMKGDISNLLVSNVEVRALYTQLVPGTVSNIDFWGRYYHRRHLLEEEEARRLELVRRAEETKEQKELGWDEDDDDWTEARAILSATETTDIKVSSDAAAAENSEELHPGLTTVNLSSDVSDKNLTETAKASTDLSDTEPAVNQGEPKETCPEVDIKPDSEPDLETISRVETSSSNFSEVSSVPTSNNSIDTLAVVTAGDVQSLESAHSSNPSLSGWSGLSDARASEDGSTKLIAFEKHAVADKAEGRKMSSDDSSNNKESLDDEWEKDFDVEVTEEDLIAARKFQKSSGIKKGEGAGDGPEDWEDW